MTDPIQRMYDEAFAPQAASTLPTVSLFAVSHTWTNDDQVDALDQGWGVFDNSDHGQRIERHGSRFDCDAAAQAYVAYRAIMYPGIERKAFGWLAWWHAVSDAAEDHS